MSDDTNVLSIFSEFNACMFSKVCRQNAKELSRLQLLLNQREDHIRTLNEVIRKLTARLEEKDND